MSKEIILPGDKISSIEEYEAGNNTFDDGNMVRSLVVGTPDINKTERIANVKDSNFLSIPKVGDVVIGTVAAVLSSIIAVSIDYINEKKVKSHVECICSTRKYRKRNIALLGDLVTLKIIGHLNGTIHADFDGPELGVLFTKCHKCGGGVILVRDAVKCKECSWIEERKLSKNFENSDFVKLRD